MDYFDDPEHVDAYIKSTADQDSQFIIDVLDLYLIEGATVLELGMGPGRDLELLNQHYAATGSDRSQIFLDRYAETHPNQPLLRLDAETIDTYQRFDCIYSNKVLPHLSTDALRHSLERQQAVLHPHGLICHTFWRGRGTEAHYGLKTTYYEVDEINDIIADFFNMKQLDQYTEINDGDSIMIIAEQRS